MGKLTYFLGRKLHENERMWTPEASLAPNEIRHWALISFIGAIVIIEVFLPQMKPNIGKLTIPILSLFGVY